MRKLIAIAAVACLFVGCTKDDPVRTAFPATVGRPRHSVPVKRPAKDSTATKSDTTYVVKDTTKLRRGVNIIRL